MESENGKRIRKPVRRYGSWVTPDNSERKWCICELPDDHTKYIQCNGCDEWYHTRCCGIEDVLPGIKTGALNLSHVHFYCGESMCTSTECYCTYERKKTFLKFNLTLQGKNISIDSTENEDVKYEYENDNMNVIIEDVNCEDDDMDFNIEDVKESTENANIGVDIEDAITNSDDAYFDENVSESDLHQVYNKDSLEVKTGIKGNTLEELAKCEIPASGIFEKKVSSPYKTKMDDRVWKDLVNNYLVTKGNKNYFKSGSYQNVICNMIKEANPYCSIMIKRHLVYNATKRTPRTGLVFTAEGYCKHTSCLVKKVSISIDKDMVVTICFIEPVVKHIVGDTASRPISGIQRSNEINNVQGKRFSATVEYAKRINNVSPDAFVAGNRDGMGKSPNVLKQIGYEGRTKDRLDSMELDSLLKMKQKFIEEDLSQSSVRGFIQVVSVDPVLVFLWTRASIKVFHDVCKTDAVFWDATGSVVKTRLTSKNLFYYELTIRNPVSGTISLPVSIMISSCHTQPTIQYWLSTFRNHERMLYGSRNVSQPIQINSDRSMALVLSALNVYNEESLELFLLRSWKIVNGNAQKKELLMTIVHCCAFHFMRNCKELIKRCFKVGKRASMMWMMSLLMNKGTLDQINEVVNLIIIITVSRKLNDAVKKAIGTLNVLLKSFKSSCSTANKDAIEAECRNLDDARNSDNGYKNLEPSESPFKEHFQKNFDVVKANVIKEGSSSVHATVNGFYSEDFFPSVLKNFLPTLPLWSCLLLGDLSRHGASKEYSGYKLHIEKHPRKIQLSDDDFVNKTTGVSEKRMNFLYNSLLGAKPAARLDDFVAIVYENITGMQKMFATSVLSHVAATKKSRVVAEGWDKKRTKRTKASYQNGSGKDETIILETKTGKTVIISRKYFLIVLIRKYVLTKKEVTT